MALVVRWLVNTLHQQYCSRSEKYGNEKKPLNPFLGELFLGHWDEPEIGRTEMVSEQVSHHPPVTAYHISNEKHKISLQGYNGQKASFSRTIHIKQIGHSLLTLHPPGSDTPETYLITLPALHIENLIYGAPFVELGKFTHVVSSSGYTAKLDYAGKGWLSGKKNTFTAAIWESAKGSEKAPLYSLDGQWSDTYTLKEGDGKKGKELETIKTKDVKLSKLILAPLEEQDPLESRKAWRSVARSIEKGDMDATSYYKSRIENAQRALRKQEQEENRAWQQVYFSNSETSDPFEQQIQKLVKVATSHHLYYWEGVAPEKTNGIWRFDPKKADAAKDKKPLHDDYAQALGLQDDATSAPATRVSTNVGTVENPDQ